MITYPTPLSQLVAVQTLTLHTVTSVYLTPLPPTITPAALFPKLINAGHLTKRSDVLVIGPTFQLIFPTT